MLQKFGRLIEQVNRDEPVCQTPDHLVTLATDRRHFAKIVEQAERFDRRHPLAPVTEEQRIEGRSGIVLDRARPYSELGCTLHRRAHDVEGVAIAPFFRVEAASELEAFDFGSRRRARPDVRVSRNR